MGFWLRSMVLRTGGDQLESDSGDALSNSGNVANPPYSLKMINLTASEFLSVFHKGQREGLWEGALRTEWWPVDSALLVDVER